MKNPLRLVSAAALLALLPLVPTLDSLASPEPVPFWETLSPTDETVSTHLWIVNRAVSLLGRHGDLAPAKNAVTLMNDSACRARWQQGLIDADYKAKYNNGNFDIWVGASDATIVLSGATWESHFYDPDTRTNYKGKTRPTAKTETLAHLANAKTFLKNRDRANGCYELGLALHYLTDITQPMHAANYTATSTPVKLHSHLEMYTMGMQAGHVLPDWMGAPSGTLSAVVDGAAVTSKAQWPLLWDAVKGAYAARCTSIYLHPSDNQSCWSADANVDGEIGDSLRAAQQSTAEFIYAADLRP